MATSSLSLVADISDNFCSNSKSLIGAPKTKNDNIDYNITLEHKEI